jgi:hypothetical protein
VRTSIAYIDGCGGSGWRLTPLHRLEWQSAAEEVERLPVVRAAKTAWGNDDIKNFLKNLEKDRKIVTYHYN